MNRFFVWIILASATLTVMAGAIIAPVLNLIRQELNIDPGSVGLVITMHSIIIAVASPAVGKIIDKFGPKKPFMAGLLLYGIAGGSGLFLTSYWPLIISRVFLGVAVAGIINSITVIILNYYQEAQRNKIMGWRASTNSLGGVIWPLIGGGLGVFSWHMPFSIYLISIPLVFLTYFTMPADSHKFIQNADKEGSVINVLRKTPMLFALYFIMFLTMVVLYVVVIFLPPILEKIGLSNPFYISVFLAVMALAGAIISFIYSRIKSKLSYNIIILIVFLLWSVGLMVLFQIQTVPVIVFSLILLGIGQGLVFPTLNIWIGDLVQVNFRGRTISYLSTCGYVGQFATPVIFGPAVLLWGLSSVYLITGTIAVLLFLTVLVTTLIVRRN